MEGEEYREREEGGREYGGREKGRKYRGRVEGRRGTLEGKNDTGKG